ncbi:alpha/beta hydrolase [Paenibacillus silviterrae]|uniref:alpha/beta hydrolase n=1 Tax=Paenibacillus silviterrae TaxID=3242194 RepID=UPI002543CF43|nr:alpha/beta hydrolase family protein [Paenibacillus chinjuensis]
MSVQTVPFFSGALYARKTCNVYLPPSYAASLDRRYPVIYLLHGLHGSEWSWLQNGKAQETLDRMIGEGQLRECIVVMPSDGGYGTGTFYLNWYDGTGRFEDYLIEDVIPLVDDQFRTVAESSQRYVCGLSMGGYGAFMLALRHPELFGAAASIAGAMISSKFLAPEFHRSDAARMIGPVHGAYAKEYDLHVLAERAASLPNRPALHFNCGKNDYLYPMNVGFQYVLEALQYPFEYMEFEGEHTWDYFGGHLPEALQFLERQWALTDC